MKHDYDVIVVGAGGSGLAAALAVCEHGGSVLVLEKRPQPGGTTGIAVGSFTAAGTSFQRAAGVADDPQAHAEDAARFPPADVESRNHEELRRYFLSEAAATLEWLTTLGLAFVGPSPEPPNRVPRMHNVVPGAKAYIAALQSALTRAGGVLLCDAPVRSLMQADGRVFGVRAEVGGQPDEFTARGGIILAAGDYASDPQTIAEHKGERFRQIEGINPFSTGDGHRLAGQAGAQLVNMDVTYGPELRFVPSARRPFQQWLPASGLWARAAGFVAPRLPRWIMKAMIKRLLVTWQHPESALFDDGAILLNRDGRRFVNETRCPEREIAVAAQSGKEAYLLLDGRLVEKYSAWPHFISTAPDIAYAYLKDYQRLRADVTTTGATLAEAAARRELRPETVQQTVDQFNDYVQGDCQDTWGRSGDQHALSRAPWVLLGPVKAYFTTTEGGARVNHQLQALDPHGEVIPGLYAVGQNGLGGQILWGHGLHIAWALTSGRLAGRAVMDQPVADQPFVPAKG